VAGRGNRRLLGVEALVEPVVDPKAIAPGGGRHELPQALCARARDGHRVEAALDHRGEHQFVGKALLAENVEDHRQVLPGPRQPFLDHGTAVTRLKPIDELADVMVFLDLVLLDRRDGDGDRQRTLLCRRSWRQDVRGRRRPRQTRIRQARGTI
jgi:hypothetical protein